MNIYLIRTERGHWFAICGGQVVEGGTTARECVRRAISQ